MMGTYIRRQRELSRMSMRQMSTMVGISNPYLSQIERGLRVPSATVTAAIATSLGLSVDELYARSGVAPRATGESPELRQAILHAPELGRAQRDSLLGIYESFIRVNQARRSLDQDPETAALPQDS